MKMSEWRLGRSETGTGPTQALRRPYMGAGVLGLVAFFVNLAAAPLSGIANWAGLVLEVLAAALAAWVGFAARRAGAKPAWQGAAVVLIYAIPSGLGTLLNPVTYQDELRFLMARDQVLAHSILRLTRSQIVRDAHLYTTGTAHAAAFVGGIVYRVAFGLVLGWIGSLFYIGRAVRASDG